MATVNTPQEDASAHPGLPRTVGVPSHIVEAGLMSPTSNAVECFGYQRFSGKLQAYLIDYVSKIYGEYPVYGA